MNRRELITLFGLGTAGVLAETLYRPSTALAVPVSGSQPHTASARRVLRIAHLTDIHIERELGAMEGLAQCLRHVQSQSDKPDVIFLTGDCIFDAFHNDRAHTQMLWDDWNRVLKAECSIKIHPLLGNHDIWGWDKSKSRATGLESQWGKRWACDELGLARPYYSFDRAGWHMIFLDSIQPASPDATGNDYIAKLGHEQFAWLESDLAATPPTTPVMVMSHAPILSMSSCFGFDVKSDGNTLISNQAMHCDWRPLKVLFKKHPNVKLAISGHLHLLERLDYDGVTYLCNGAVCGGWWKEKNMGDGDTGYALIDLYDDGSFDHEYVSYGWKYRSV